MCHHVMKSSMAAMLSHLKECVEIEFLTAAKMNPSDVRCHLKGICGDEIVS